MKHGNSCPSMCSQCLGAVPQRVTTNGPDVLIDGVPTGRQLDRERGVQTYYARRRRKT